MLDVRLLDIGSWRITSIFDNVVIKRNRIILRSQINMATTFGILQASAVGLSRFGSSRVTLHMSTMVIGFIVEVNQNGNQVIVRARCRRCVFEIDNFMLYLFRRDSVLLQLRALPLALFGLILGFVAAASFSLALLSGHLFLVVILITKL